MLFFKRKSSPAPVIKEKSQQKKPHLSYHLPQNILKQLKVIQLTESDLSVAMVLQPIVRDNIQQIVDVFYDMIGQAENLRNIINEHSTIE